jgi:hypothetical protein
MRHRESITINGCEIYITLSPCTRNVEYVVWIARYVPPAEEVKQPVWFGYVDKDKKWRGRKPQAESRSGITKKEAAARLASWLEVAYRGWHNYLKCEA